MSLHLRKLYIRRICRIELLKHGVNHQADNIFNSWEENDVEHVDTYRTWIYFRKKRSAEALRYIAIWILVSNITRISNLWLAIGVLNYALVFHKFT